MPVLILLVMVVGWAPQADLERLKLKIIGGSSRMKASYHHHVNSPVSQRDIELEEEVVFHWTLQVWNRGPRKPVCVIELFTAPPSIMAVDRREKEPLFLLHRAAKQGMPVTKAPTLPQRHT